MLPHRVALEGLFRLSWALACTGAVNKDGQAAERTMQIDTIWNEEDASQ